MTEVEGFLLVRTALKGSQDQSPYSEQAFQSSEAKGHFDNRGWVGDGLRGVLGFRKVLGLLGIEDGLIFLETTAHWDL